MKPISILLLALALAFPGVSGAQFNAPVLPLNTTLVLEKPAPDQGFGRRKIIEIGVKQQTYRFILRDAYVDDPTGKFFWSDVWRSVQQFKPNFQAQGIDSDTFEKIKPGDVVTVIGMYSMATRTFEVANVAPGGGNFAPKQAY